MRARLAALATTALLARPAAADGPPAPPPGWEVPPPLPAAPPRGRAPACCGYDQTCCERQREIDAVRMIPVAKIIEVRLADLPEIIVKNAGDAGIDGAPAVRAIDGEGRPPPWSNGPQRELRVMPPGRYGEITWHSQWSEPFFTEPEYRGMGYGMVISTDPRWRKPTSEKVELTGPVRFIGIDKGPGDRIVYDAVEGSLSGTPAVAATRWEHVEAAPVFDSYVHAWRGKLENDPAVVFLLPMVLLGFESLDAKSHGGRTVSRFSRSVAFTRYTLPYGPGRSALVTFDLLDSWIRRWFPRPVNAEKVPERRDFVIAVSQTSAEPEPRAHIFYFGKPSG